MPAPASPPSPGTLLPDPSTCATVHHIPYLGFERHHILHAGYSSMCPRSTRVQWTTALELSENVGLMSTSTWHWKEQNFPRQFLPICRPEEKSRLLSNVTFQMKPGLGWLLLCPCGDGRLPTCPFDDWPTLLGRRRASIAAVVGLGAAC